ncbi:MAG: hypothetical protein Kow0056_13110 [Coriobacteriia bacterium]
MVAADEVREPRKFEPPPWEKEQFEAIQRRKQESGQGRPGAPGEDEAGSGAGPTEAQQAPVRPQEQGPTGEQPATQGDATRPAGEERTKDIEAEAEALLASLSLEERETAAGPDPFKLAIGAAAFLVFVGTVFLIYAFIALSRSYQAGLVAVVGSMIVALMGLMFIGTGAWMGIRAYNRR